MTEPAKPPPPKKSTSKPAARSRGRSIDAKTRARIIELAQSDGPDGLPWSAGAIAKDCDVAQSSVTRIVKAALPDHVWRGAKLMADATDAHTDRMKAKRLDLSGKLIDRVEKLLTALDDPHTVVGWYQGFASEHVLDKPTSGDVKNYAIALGILLDKHAMLVKFDSDDRDLPAVDAWHDHMMAGGA